MSLIYDSLFGVKVGDALGAPWEMQSRKQILSQWKNVTNGFKKRQGKYGIYHQPGMYTDDFEMTMGTFNALQESYPENVTPEMLTRHWILIAKVFNNRDYGGVRDGYGSFRNILNQLPIKDGMRDISDKALLDSLLQNQRAKQNQRDDPGNGPLMRQIPFVFANTDYVDPCKCVIVNVLATHPHPNAIMSALCMMRASQYLLIEKQNPKDLLKDLIKFCVSENIRKWWPKDTEFENMKLNISNVDQFRKRLLFLESCDAPGNEQCDKLDDRQIEQMFGPTSCNYYKGIGIPPSSQQTFYTSVYLLKWMDDASAFGNLLRCISLGGDVDTVASIVGSMVFPLKNLKDLPKWVIDDIEK